MMAGFAKHCQCGTTISGHAWAQVERAVQRHLATECPLSVETLLSALCHVQPPALVDSDVRRWLAQHRGSLTDPVIRQWADRVVAYGGPINL